VKNPLSYSQYLVCAGTVSLYYPSFVQSTVHLTHILGKNALFYRAQVPMGDYMKLLSVTHTHTHTHSFGSGDQYSIHTAPVVLQYQHITQHEERVGSIGRSRAV
jgi:hypothetical protein